MHPLALGFIGLLLIVLGIGLVVSDTRRFDPIGLSFQVPTTGCLGYVFGMGGIVMMIIALIQFLTTYTFQVVPR